MSIRRTRWRLALATSAAGLAVVFAIAGCGSGGDSNNRGTDSKAAAPAADNAGAPLGAGGADAPKHQGGAAPAQVPEQLPPDSPSHILTGTITVRVNKVDEAAAIV